MNPLALIRPWYLFRPSQVIRRLARAASPPRDPVQVVTLPWGCTIEVDTRETIGRSLWNTGVYDLPVAETLIRAADRGLLSLDVGANIGSMTGLLAAHSGEVWAFEPNPLIESRLRRNVARFADTPTFAPCRVFDLALSDTDGEAVLETPAGSETNHGLARIAASPEAGLPVKTVRLDNILEGREVGVLKLDVEGHEPSVLVGAADSLAGGRIRAVVYEDHTGPDGEAGRLLAGFGYRIYAIGWRLFGPLVSEHGRSAARTFEAPNYLATRSEELVERCRERGWVSLGRRY